MNHLTIEQLKDLLAINKRIHAATAIPAHDESPESERIRLDYHEELAAEIEQIEAELKAKGE